jgi:hypothetical protein
MLLNLYTIQFPPMPSHRQKFFVSFKGDLCSQYQGAHCATQHRGRFCPKQRECSLRASKSFITSAYPERSEGMQECSYERYATDLCERCSDRLDHSSQENIN